MPYFKVSFKIMTDSPNKVHLTNSTKDNEKAENNQFLLPPLVC